MPLRFPVRRYIQTLEKVQAPASRWGGLQWVLSRALYRFHVIDLSQVPARSRAQALQLGLIQWTPFARSAYYIAWQGEQAMVWAWDAERVAAAMAAQGLNAQRVLVLPETVLRRPLARDGLLLQQCIDGCEGQLWRQGLLAHSRWWPQAPSAEEWLMFQRDAALPPAQQQTVVPTPLASGLAEVPWLDNAGAPGSTALGTERLLLALTSLLLFAATCWYGATWYKLHNQVEVLALQKAQLQAQATPIAQARGQALDDLAKVQSLRALAPYPEQLQLMAKVAQSLPADKSFLKEWDFQWGQLKFTLSSAADIAATGLIARFQQDSPLREMKALPGRDQKNVTFQADVQRN